jgi:hypothetical protein
LGFRIGFFIVNADRKAKVAWPKPPDEEQLKLIRERIEAQSHRLPMEFEIAPEAKAAWEDWYQNVKRSEQTNRLDTIGLRLMPLIALTTDKDVVDLETVQVVTSILDYELLIRLETDPIDADLIPARAVVCTTI